jgi:hypothetical protein
MEVQQSMSDEAIKTSKELEFAIFCIENVAQKLNTSAEDIYKAFTEKSNILNGYIVPCYETLHTQGKDYIIDDIISVMKSKDISL